MIKKILFFCNVGAKVGGYETEVAVLCNLLKDLGNDVVLLNTLQINEEFTSIAYLDKSINYTSLHQLNMHGLKYKFLNFFLNSYYKFKPNKNYLVQSHRFLKAYFNLSKTPVAFTYFLSKFNIVYMLGKPKPEFARLISLSNGLGLKTIYHDVSDISKTYMERPDHHLFVKNAHLINVVLGSSLEKIGQLNLFLKSPRIIHLEQWAYKTEEVLLSLPISKQDNEVYSFGLISRIVPNKGVLDATKTFIKIYKNKKAGDRKFIVNIAGTGTDFEELKKLTANYPEIFKIWGFIPNEKITDFFKSFDIFLNPSLFEGGPITCLEGMAAGKVTISSAVGAMPERFENIFDQFLFSPGNWIEMEKILNNVLAFTPEEIVSYKYKMREYYLSKYSREIIKKEIKNIIQTL